MNTERRAAALLFLLFPALLFMGAVALRNIRPLQPGAEQIVMWYAGRMWTLWVLLLALPFVVFATGCVTLFSGRSYGAAIRRPGSALENQPNHTTVLPSRGSLGTAT